MRAPQALRTASAAAGTWRVVAHPNAAQGSSGPFLDVTTVRGIPTTLGSWAFDDPYGPKTLTLTFPKVTIFDRLGVGDLAWLAPWTDFSVVYTGALPTGYPYRQWAWEGYSVSFDHSTDGLVVSLVGAMYQIDNYLAKPLYLSRPLPYERAIANAFTGKPDLRLKPLRVDFPSWWSQFYSLAAADPYTGQPALRGNIPVGVAPGERWTGLVTRESGSWDELLTSYVQSLLASMYTDRGRWSLVLEPGRQPVLMHRDYRTVAGADMLVVDPMAPGVQVSLSEDWSQSLSVAYGQGVSRSGSAFSGMRVSADGETTTYEPLAALRQVHPTDDRNGWLQSSRMRKEVKLQVQQGLELDEARQVGAAHLAAFSEPGYTGTITLQSDPTWNGTVLPHPLIREGMSVQVPQLFGAPEGVVLHISSVSVDLASNTTTLTVDSKYRDALTVDEVRLRGRDSLSIQRQLIGGKFAPVLPDQLMPWNYAEGSGVIPSGPTFNATRLFEGMPPDTLFPWTSWTTQRPPNNPAFTDCYARIGPTSSNANNNWAGVGDAAGGLRLGLPVKLAQAGTIRLLEIAAYDRNGNVMRVPFHFSIYTSRGVNVLSMPTLSDADSVPPYLTGQKYPFFAGAWEQYRTDGTKISTEQPVSVSSAGLVRAYGTGLVKAGYWPGSSLTGDPATGLLRDEGSFEFDTTQDDASVNPFSGALGAYAGYVYVMIYCDAQLTNEVFFLGRMYRVEPGSST